ncbi:MAG TPA: hypothetical protein VE963_04145 [Reyranella sp.]|nr:hypothetical protein [Reyranella sp.]
MSQPPVDLACCARCRFFDRIECPDGPPVPGPHDMVGRCLRHAPQPELVAETADNLPTKVAVWPHVMGGNWCGDFAKEAA